MECLIYRYKNGTISLIIQETIPWRTIFHSVAWRIEGIILKSEGHSKNQILSLTVLPSWKIIIIIIIIILARI